ncbi:hypothetical protein MTO96_032210 [Rhipicephalus appendiculatus]
MKRRTESESCLTLTPGGALPGNRTPRNNFRLLRRGEAPAEGGGVRAMLPMGWWCKARACKCHRGTRRAAPAVVAVPHDSLGMRFLRMGGSKSNSRDHRSWQRNLLATRFMEERSPLMAAVT